MRMQEFVIRGPGPSWQIWQDDALLGAEPTRTRAVSVAQALAQMAVRRGVESKIVIDGLDGLPIEHSVIKPWSTGMAGRNRKMPVSEDGEGVEDEVERIDRTPSPHEG